MLNLVWDQDQKMLELEGSSYLNCTILYAIEDQNPASVLEVTHHFPVVV